MTELKSTIEIDAPVERVWEVLTDFKRFSQWNPFIVKASGKPAVGEHLEVTIRPPGRQAMTFRPAVLAATPNQELRWLGRLWIPGLFDGEHSHRLEALGPARTLYVQSERFRGLLVPLAGATLRDTEKGFELMNRALKAKVEETASDLVKVQSTSPVEATN